MPDLPLRRCPVCHKDTHHTYLSCGRWTCDECGLKENWGCPVRWGRYVDPHSRRTILA